MQPKRQYPITSEVPQHVSNVERLAILPLDAPKNTKIKSAITAHRRVIMPINATTSKPRKRRKYIQKIEDEYDPDLDSYYMEDCFPKDSHD
jgi:hypothetical protein